MDLADEIQDLAGEVPRPFGSVKVRARVGETAWSTSIFRDTNRESYLLPVKAAGDRAAERLARAEEEIDRQRVATPAG